MTRVAGPRFVVRVVALDGGERLYELYDRDEDHGLCTSTRRPQVEALCGLMNDSWRRRVAGARLEVGTW